MQDFSRDKTINAMIYFLKNTQHCGITKLLKLLNQLDFIHFKQTGKSVTGQIYYAWERGPVPVDLWKELHNPGKDLLESFIFPSDKGENSFYQIKPRKSFSDLHLTKREMRILEKLAFFFKEAKAEDIVELTHLPGMPWDTTLKKKGLKAEISYFLALDDTEDSLSREDAEEVVSDGVFFKEVLS